MVERWKRDHAEALIVCRTVSTLDASGNIIKPRKITVDACRKYRRVTAEDEAIIIGGLKLRRCDDCPHKDDIKLTKSPRAMRGRSSGKIPDAIA